MNRAAEDLLGYSRDEILVMKAGTRALTGAWRGEMEVRHKNGRIIPVESSVMAVHLPGGPVYTGTIRDISDRRALTRMQQEFISMVTHELKIPLTSIRGFAQLMKRRGQINELGIDTILMQADRLDRLIADLLDSARVEAGRLKLQLRLTNLIAVTRSCVESARHQSDKHTIQLNAPATEMIGRWDRERLEQIVSNLLSNAVKYSPEGGNVEVTITDGEPELTVCVRDHGVGISSDDIRQLFSRFSRLQNARESDAPGLGLGLYITKSLVKAHGGRTWVESEVGRVSTFSFSLPR